MNLGIVIDLRFQIIATKIPTLLCVKDMIENGLDISIKYPVVKMGDKEQRIQLGNYLLVHRWYPNNVQFVF